MLLFSQVVKQVYMLNIKYLDLFLWQFFFTFKTATNLPQN